MKFDPTTAKPREVEAYLREQVRKLWGDKTENGAVINASHGYYNVSIYLDNSEQHNLLRFRKKDIPRIVRTLRVLASK